MRRGNCCVKVIYVGDKLHKFLHLTSNHAMQWEEKREDALLLMCARRLLMAKLFLNKRNEMKQRRTRRKRFIALKKLREG